MKASKKIVLFLPIFVFFFFLYITVFMKRTVLPANRMTAHYMGGACQLSNVNIHKVNLISSGKILRTYTEDLLLYNLAYINILDIKVYILFIKVYGPSNYRSKTYR